jgi:hypothetical protein
MCHAFFSKGRFFSATNSQKLTILARMIGWSLRERYIGIENTVYHRKELGVVCIAEGDIRISGPLRLP